jgi:fused signal recognition particle receptor
MGLFDKLKSLISKKEKIKEEVKKEYNVEDVSEISEDMIEEIEEFDDIEEELEEEDVDVIDDDDSEEEVEEEHHCCGHCHHEEEKHECHCGDECKCGDDCQCGDDCHCHDSEDDVCSCGCDCGEDCDCGCQETGECHCHDEDLEEIDEDEDTDEEDEEWAEFIKAHQKVKEAQDIETYDKGLEKTRKEFVSKLSMLGVKYTKVDEDYFEELEEILINADVGVNTVMNFIDQLRDRVKKEKITDTEYLNEVIVDELFIIYVDNESLSDKINIAEDGPTVILMVGVNGVGKTTTIAKLAHKYISEGKKVMMIAGDTFRAGAVQQLEEWAGRTGATFYGKENTDPAGVIFDGLVKAKEDEVDIVLIDTAGRLQNKVNLMKELEKVNKVIGKHIPNAPHETLLVIDATTGQNGISQAKAFKEITDITGIVLTKLDGTAKGGIVLAIKEEVKIPVKFIGLGEKMTDLKTFDIENYIYGLFKDMM